MIALLLSIALATGAVLACWRARRWSVGRSAPVAVLRGALRLPRGYFHDVHDVVSRDRYAARMHVLAAGGFVGAVLLVFAVHLFGAAWPPLVWLLMVFLFAMALGALYVLARRWPKAEARLSKGSFQRLPWSLLAFALFFFWASLPQAGAPPIDWGAPLAWAMFALGVWGAAEMIAFFPVGPMKHAFAGALHLVCHPRSGRFGAARPDSALRALDLSAPRLGAETPADFSWNQLLGFDACVQCGRCEAVCPAFAAELPLNPKKLIQDLARAMDGTGTDARYAGSPHPGREIGRARGGPRAVLIGVDAMIHPDTLWACTTCRACVYECPMLIEHVDAVVHLRRFQALERGAVPGKAPHVLAELRETDNPGGHALSSRLDWAADLSLPILAEGGECDVLLWLGEGAFDLRNQRTLRALVRLMRRAGIDFAVLGEAELDSGDLARRLGDEAIFQSLAQRNVAILDRRAFSRIVTADPHVFHSLRNEYPAFGGEYTVLHHTTFLAELLEAGKLAPRAKPEGKIAYHDPCYLARYNGEIAAPRAVLDAIGAERVEMDRSGMRAMCCGGGGGAPVTDVAGKRRIPDLRMDQARATGASVLAVACPNCANMLEGVTGARPDVTDIAELLDRATEGP